MESLRGPMQKFAISLFQACRKDHPTGNFLYSPFTASTGLLLVLLGSDGETRAEIESAMKFEHSPIFATANFESDLKMAYRYAMAVIHKVIKEQDETNEDYGAMHVFRMNKLFFDSRIKLREEFIALVKKLRGEISFIDFARSSSSARQQMNDYVGEKMNGRVRECFAQGVITRDTQMVLANGICFRAGWDVTFDKERTTSEPFHQLDGKSINVPMMNGTYYLPYVRDPNTDMTYVEIPYASNTASLLILLPNKRDGLPDLTKKISPGVFKQISHRKRFRQVDISLPKFQMHTQLDMKSLLMKVQIKSIFTDHADLSKMSDQELSLSFAIHTGFFCVDELGTDANCTRKKGAITNSYSPDKRMSVDSGKLVTPLAVKVDHPFLFAVRHNKSGIMICLGRVETIEL